MSYVGVANVVGTWSINSPERIRPRKLPCVLPSGPCVSSDTVIACVVTRISPGS